MMKAKQMLLGILLLVACSCANESRKVERISMEVSVVSDSIESMMPGELLVYDDYAVWNDPFNGDEYIHVLDLLTGKEIKIYGRIYRWTGFHQNSSHGFPV